DLNMGETIRRQPSNFGGSAATNGSGYKENQKMSSWISTSLLEYSTNIKGEHNIDALAGFEIQKTNYSGTLAEQENFLPNTIYLDGASSPTGASSYFNDNSIVSQLARLNYNYKEKYYLNLSARRDGSSKFYVSNKLYGNFYSVGASWNIG